MLAKIRSACFKRDNFCVICKPLQLLGKMASNKCMNEEQTFYFNFVEDIQFFSLL